MQSEMLPWGKHKTLAAAPLETRRLHIIVRIAENKMHIRGPVTFMKK